jgi:hypothetical protein
MANPKRNWMLLTEMAKRLGVTVTNLKADMKEAGLMERVHTTTALIDGGMVKNYADVPTNRAHQINACKNKRGETGRQATKYWDFDVVCVEIGIPF